MKDWLPSQLKKENQGFCMSANQCERTAESSELTHSSREEPFKQCSVQIKRKFHEHFASLSPKCFTCLEHFPGIQLYPSITECMQGYRDKHIPKLYSSTNNMNPGPLPPQLKVSTCVCFITIIIRIVFITIARTYKRKLKSPT